MTGEEKGSPASTPITSAGVTSTSVSRTDPLAEARRPRLSQSSRYSMPSLRESIAKTTSSPSCAPPSAMAPAITTSAIAAPVAKRLSPLIRWFSPSATNFRSGLTGLKESLHTQRASALRRYYSARGRLVRSIEGDAGLVEIVVAEKDAERGIRARSRG